MTQIQETPALTATRWECQCDSGGYIRTDDAEEAAAWVADGRSVTAWGQVNVSPWLPIDTAPQTGQTVLLGYLNSCSKWRSVRGQWMSQAFIDEYWEDPDDGEAGWFETADESETCWPVSPTHWMPLPAAPVSGKGEA